MPLRTRYALRSHITLGTSRYGGHRHGLLVKIGSRSPRLPTFAVIAAQPAGETHRHSQGPPSGVSRPTCSCMVERLTWRRVWIDGGDLQFSGFRGGCGFRYRAGSDCCRGIRCVAFARHLRLDKRPSYADTKVNDSKPFDPKHHVLKVPGSPGTVATISYFDVNAEPQYIEGASRPWSLDFAITVASAAASVVAQGDSDDIGCRISWTVRLKPRGLPTR